MSDTQPDASDLFELPTTGNSARARWPRCELAAALPAASPGCALEKCGDDEGKEIESFHGWFKSTATRKSKACDLSWEFVLEVFRAILTKIVDSFVFFFNLIFAGSESHRARSSIFLSEHALACV